MITQHDFSNQNRTRQKGRLLKNGLISFFQVLDLGVNAALLRTCTNTNWYNYSKSELYLFTSNQWFVYLHLSYAWEMIPSFAVLD